NTNTGPLVFLNPGRHFRFINNTVAGNTSINSTPNAIILRGCCNPNGGGNGGNGFIDMHNNIFYDNFATAATGSLAVDGGGQFLCVSNDGAGPVDHPENGAQDNWA